MIYLLSTSKKSNKECRTRLPVADTIEFLLELDRRRFRTTSFTVLSSDTVEELRQVFDYFNPDYFIKKSQGIFDVYNLNEELLKEERTLKNGIKFRAVNRFKKKIRDKFKNGIVNFKTFSNYFEITVEIGSLRVVMEFDYTFTLTVDKSQYETQEEKAVVTTVNDIFRKQRYYYRKKVIV